MVTMVAAYVLCGELLGVLISRILRLYYIDVAFVWLGGIMLWLWYWFGVQPGDRASAASVDRTSCYGSAEISGW